MHRYTFALTALLIVVVSLKSADGMAPAPKADVNQLAESNNSFCIELFARLRESNGNLFYSPYSISTALAMTLAGARGETADQMASVLQLKLPHDQIPGACSQLIRDLNGGGLPRDYELQVANSLWAAPDIRFLKDYQQLLKTDFGSQVHSVNFRGDPEKSRGAINSWVADRTRDKIKDLLHASDVTASTRLVLVNAIYFKGKWLHAFDPKYTKTGVPFEESPGNTTEVAMMNELKNFNYMETDALQAVELPYEGGELSLVILLPKRNALLELEQSLSYKQLHGWLAQLKSETVSLEIPKFRITGRFDLGQELSGMGMEAAFDAGQADFSGMSKDEKLVLSRVVHQAFVDVDESGTEAAAATAVSMVPMAAAHPSKPVTFRADHPFLFLLRDMHSGCILFFGRMSSPKTAGETAKGAVSAHASLPAAKARRTSEPAGNRE